MGDEICLERNETMLEIHNISRSYTGSSQTHTVIDHLNLTVCDHDFFVIVGPSGCGKSTLLGLSGFENAYPHQLSGGMKQRAALARALSLKPKVLLMDEPFSSLDIATKKALYPVVTAMAAQTGCTILLVTHDIREARTLGSHIAVMSRQKKGISAVFSKEAMPEAETLEKMLEENT